MFLRIASTAISVITLILASLLPYIGLQTKDVRNSKIFCSYSNYLPLFTCFSCGIFLSTCFIGLFPHIQDNEDYIKTQLNNTNPKLLAKYELVLDSNLMIMVGFLLIVLIEQSVVFCMSKPAATTSNGQATTRRTATGLSETNLLTQTDNEPLVRFNGETDSESDDDGIGKIEFRSNTNARVEAGGHSHSHDHHFVPNGSSFFQSFILLFALSVHSIFEGIALGAQTSDSDFLKFLISVMLHEVLCSFAYGVKLSKNNVPLRSGLLSILFLSFTIPIGIGFISLFLNAKELTTLIIKFVLEGIAAGTFIYVACVEMLAEELHSNSNQGFSKAIALCFGFLTFFVFNYLVHV